MCGRNLGVGIPIPHARVPNRICGQKQVAAVTAAVVRVLAVLQLLLLRRVSIRVLAVRVHTPVTFVRSSPLRCCLFWCCDWSSRWCSSKAGCHRRCLLQVPLCDLCL